MNITPTAPALGARERFDLSSASLHLIAMASMLIDHAMKTVIEYDGWIFVLGRLAFPIFAFMVAEGCVHTRSPLKYGLRLLIFALIAEIPYDLMKSDRLFDTYDQNVIWTFLIAFLCITAYRRIKALGKPALSVAAGIFFILLGFMAGTIFSVDYGGMGVMMVFVFYFLRQRKWWTFLLQFVLLFFINVIFLGGFDPMQAFAMFALIPIWLYRGRQGYHSKPFQFFCYAFYPVHMLILALLGGV
jgi:hypothetical protein